VPTVFDVDVAAFADPVRPVRPVPVDLLTEDDGLVGGGDVPHTGQAEPGPQGAAPFPGAVQEGESDVWRRLLSSVRTDGYRGKRQGTRRPGTGGRDPCTLTG